MVTFVGPDTQGSHNPRAQEICCFLGFFLDSGSSAPVKIKHGGGTVTWIMGSLLVPGGEGNGTPLQYSCLENPMDGGAW